MFFQVGDFHCHKQQSLRLRLHVHTMSGPNAAPATTGRIKNASTSAIWILSGSIRRGKTLDGVKTVKNTLEKAEDLNLATISV